MTYSVFILAHPQVRAFYNVAARSPAGAAAKCCGLAFGSVVPEVRVSVCPSNSIEFVKLVVGSKS